KSHRRASLFLLPFPSATEVQQSPVGNTSDDARLWSWQCVSPIARTGLISYHGCCHSVPRPHSWPCTTPPSSPTSTGSQSIRSWAPTRTWLMASGLIQPHFHTTSTSKPPTTSLPLPPPPPPLRPTTTPTTTITIATSPTITITTTTTPLTPRPPGLLRPPI